VNRVYGLGILSGVGLGLVTASGVLLSLYAKGYQWDLLTGLTAWAGLFTAGLGLMLALAPWIFQEPVEPLPYEPPVVAPVVIPAAYERVFNSARGSGVERRYKPTTATEAAWIDALSEFCLWARDLQSLTGPAHQKAGVVANPNDWQDIIQPLVDHGAILPKRQGVETRWCAQWDATRAYNAILAGYVQFPDRQPPKVRPFPTSTATIDATSPVEVESA